MNFEIMIIIWIVLIFSGFIKGFSGFGTSLILASFMFLFYDPIFIVPILSLLSFTLNIILFLMNKNNLDFSNKNFALRPETLITLLIGTFLGIFFLKSVNSDIIKLLLGVLTVVFVILLIKKTKKKINLPLWVENSIIGSISGFFSGIINVNGPPVVIFALYKKQKKNNFINSIIIFFLISDFFAIILFISQHLLFIESLKLYLIYIPFLIIGLFIGSYVRKKLVIKNLKII